MAEGVLDRRVDRLYGSGFADRYDLRADIWERRFCGHALESFHERLCSLPKRPLRVLDLGCGTGRNLRRLAAAGVEIDSYVGVDRSRRMLGRAIIKHPYSRARFESSDAIEAARAANDCDLVLATWVLSHQADPERFLDEARAALAPDGHLLVLALTRPHQVLGRLHGWRFERFLSARPLDPWVLQFASPTFLAISAGGLVTCADFVGPSRRPQPRVDLRSQVANPYSSSSASDIQWISAAGAASRVNQ